MTAQGSSSTYCDEQTCPLCIITSVSLDSISMSRSGDELGENNVAPWVAISVLLLGYCIELCFFLQWLLSTHCNGERKCYFTQTKLSIIYLDCIPTHPPKYLL